MLFRSQKALKELAERYKYAKIAFRGQASFDDQYVQRTEKNFNLQDRVGWMDGAEMEDALDDINKARQAQSRIVCGAKMKLEETQRLLYAFARRVGADPDDYID